MFFDRAMDMSQYRLSRKFVVGSGASVELFDPSCLPTTLPSSRIVRKFPEKIDIFRKERAGEPGAFVIDKLLFQGSAKHHEYWRGNDGEVYSLFLSGESLSTVLFEQGVVYADGVRRSLIESMIDGGYFSQLHMRSSARFFGELVIEAGGVTSTMRELKLSQATLGSHGESVYESLLQALEYLFRQDVVVPCGFFPDDMNLGNVLIDTHSVSVIDQSMAFCSPAIVPAKMIFGWNTLVKMSNSPDGFREFQDNIPQLLHADKALIALIAQQYKDFSQDIRENLLRQIGAVVVVRTARGLSLLRAKQELAPELFSQGILPFFTFAVDLFKTGEIV